VAASAYDQSVASLVFGSVEGRIGSGHQGVDRSNSGLQFGGAHRKSAAVSAGYARYWNKREVFAQSVKYTHDLVQPCTRHDQ
jgi:hypothetical protein